jgi:hypothetical protein
MKGKRAGLKTNSCCYQWPYNNNNNNNNLLSNPPTGIIHIEDKSHPVTTIFNYHPLHMILVFHHVCWFLLLIYQHTFGMSMVHVIICI